MELNTSTSIEYAKSYNTFVKYSSQATKNVDLIAKQIQNHNISSLIKGDKIRVLSIGTGTGEFDLQIIDMLLKELRTKECKSIIEYTVVEPNQEFTEEFKQRIQAKDGMKNVTFQWHVNTLEEIEENLIMKNMKYNMILSIHSIYYFVDLKTMLSKVLGELLAENGRVFIMASPEQGHVLQVADKLENIRGITKKSIPNSVSDVLHLKTEMKNYAFEIENATHPVNITKVFDENSEDGNYLLDFFTHTIHFRKNAKSNETGEILQFMKKLASVENGEYYVFDEVVLITMYKTK